MSSAELDIAKREIEIHKKELSEEWARYVDESNTMKKEMTGNLTTDWANFMVNSPKINDLKERIIDRLFKLNKAYDNYTRLLERIIGK